MDGWNTSLSYWVSAYFQGRWLLVSGRCLLPFRSEGRKLLIFKNRHVLDCISQEMMYGIVQVYIYHKHQPLSVSSLTIIPQSWLVWPLSGVVPLPLNGRFIVYKWW